MYLNHEEECGERASRMRTVEVVAKSPNSPTQTRALLPPSCWNGERE